MTISKIDNAIFTDFVTENANGGAICIAGKSIHLIFSNSIFSKCRADNGGAIYTSQVKNINASKLCGYECSSKMNTPYGYFAFFNSTNFLDANFICASYNSGRAGNCYFASKNEIQSNSNYSNSNGNQEMSFITSETTTSTTKYIIATNNIGTYIGMNSFKSNQVEISYFIYKNVSLTSTNTNDHGHIFTDKTASCRISWFYIDAPSTILHVFNCLESSMRVRNSFVKCPSNKLIDSRENIDYDSSVKITSKIPEIYFSVQKSEDCGKVFQESLINYHQFMCFLSINQLLLVLNNIIIS